MAKANFEIDWEQEKVRCPQGKSSSAWKERLNLYQQPVIYVRFKKADCHSCPFRPDCTRDKSGVRTLTLRPKQLHETLFAARARQQTSEFKEQYAVRAGIEGTICSWDESLRFTPLPLPRVSQNSIAAYYYCLRY